MMVIEMKKLVQIITLIIVVSFTGCAVGAMVNLRAVSVLQAATR